MCNKGVILCSVEYLDPLQVTDREEEARVVEPLHIGVHLQGEAQLAPASGANLRLEELQVQSLGLILDAVLQGVGPAQELMAGGQVFRESLLQN